MRRDEGADGHRLAGVAIGGLGAIAVGVVVAPAYFAAN